MPLASTFTLNVGSPAADVVYGDASHGVGSTVTYYAPSPQADLTGRPSLVFNHQTTKAGVVRSSVTFLKPYFNSTKGIYEGFVKVDVVVNRPAGLPVQLTKDELEKASEILTSTNRDIIAAGQL